MRVILSWAVLALACFWLAGATAQINTLSDNAESIAVVIGNKAYKQTSTVDFAHNDADAIKAYLISTLGFREQNVHLIKDATLSELQQSFGTESNPQIGRIWRSVVAGRSNVFVYYSGHGVPDLVSGQPFLLPQDGNPNISESGYGLQTLYRNLELVRQKIGPSRQLIVMIDACFTGETGRKGESLLAVSAPGFTPARPRTGSGIIKLVATSGSTPANWDQGQKLGLFTSRFLMGAAGLARPSGTPETGALAWADLQRYLKDSVEAAARRDSGREQAPEIDEASLTLPLGHPVPAVASAVAAAQDETNWQRAKGAGERGALEDYIASCGSACRYREEALRLLRQFQRDAQVTADRQNWQRLSREGKYADYLRSCGAVCAYRSLAENYLPELLAARDGAVRKCDELAGSPGDLDRNRDVSGVAFANLAAEQAITACQVASEQHPELRRLNFQLGRAYDKAKRYLDASSAYRKASDSGSASAAHNLALLLRDGEGLPKDEAEARKLYEKAALAGHVEAMNSLGALLGNGLGGAKDLVGAKRWYEKAAQNGHVLGMRNFALALQNGWVPPANLPEARSWYEKAAKAGDALAMSWTGYMAENGQGGPVDLPAAKRWYDQGAKAGDAFAMYRLGYMWGTALGGLKDPVEARRWFKASAEHGNIEGMCHYALALTTEDGGPQNMIEARQWFEKAARAGVAHCMYGYGKANEHGHGGPANLAEARTWYGKAAQAGNSAGMLEYAFMLRYGRGGPEDQSGARDWLRKAADLGDKNAMYSLAAMLEKGQGGPVDLAEARRWYQKSKP